MTHPLPDDRWRRVTDLFTAIVALPPAVRRERLDLECAGDDELRRDVESLLEADAPPDADAPLVRAIDAAIAGAAAAGSGVAVADHVGPYRILREIGQGGMATVFLAVRDDDFQQRVAIKVVRGALGAEALIRFRAERQILATLEHPSIARLLDGGTTAGGLPYLVMEHVDGLPIDEYCRTRDLSVRDRLLLFCRVCDAVTHAHRSLVVHRDIKPSNILVTADGTPKLLDFGIAKLLDADIRQSVPLTVAGLRVLTPEYASPEQVRGEPMTTAADVYSLGVLLYELVAGRRPLAFSTRQPAEIERVVCTIEPRKPSTAVTSARQARQLAGDVDTIVLAALRKEPVHRYPSAERLADDIRRHLAGLPVAARPATWRYRSGRFVRRHRGGVAAASVVALLVLAFAGVSVLQARRIARERDTAAQVTNLLLELYASFDPSATRGSPVTAQAVLDRGASRIQAELRDQPELQARMLDSIGSLYLAIGVPDRAAAVLDESLSIRQAIGADTLPAATTLNRLATALARQGRLADAEAFARRALDLRRRLAGGRAAETADALNTLGRVIHLQGYPVEAAPLLAEAVDIWRATKGPDSEEFAAGVGSLAQTWRDRADGVNAAQLDRADLLKAERFEREILGARRKAFGDVHALTAESLTTLVQLLRAMGRSQEAEPIAREALAARRLIFGRDDHPAAIESLHDLALVLHDTRKLTEAEPLYRRAITLLQAGAPTEPQLAITLHGLATLLEDMGRVGEAEAAYRDALATRQQLPGRESPGVARTLNNLARLLHAHGRHADALPIVEEALAIRRTTLGASHLETAASIALRESIVHASAGQPN